MLLWTIFARMNTHFNTYISDHVCPLRMLKPEYSGIVWSVPCPMMPWLLASKSCQYHCCWCAGGHHQLWYRLYITYVINGWLSSRGMYFNKLSISEDENTFLCFLRIKKTTFITSRITVAVVVVVVQKSQCASLRHFHTLGSHVHLPSAVRRKTDVHRQKVGIYFHGTENMELNCTHSACLLTVNH